jgi:hypothetical protein
MCLGVLSRGLRGRVHSSILWVVSAVNSVPCNSIQLIHIVFPLLDERERKGKSSFFPSSPPPFRGKNNQSKEEERSSPGILQPRKPIRITLTVTQTQRHSHSIQLLINTSIQRPQSIRSIRERCFIPTPIVTPSCGRWVYTRACCCLCLNGCYGEGKEEGEECCERWRCHWGARRYDHSSDIVFSSLLFLSLSLSSKLESIKANERYTSRPEYETTVKSNRQNERGLGVFFQGFRLSRS